MTKVPNKYSKWQRDPGDYDMVTQYFNKNTEHVVYPERILPEWKEQIVTQCSKNRHGSVFINIGSMYQFNDWMLGEMETNTNRRESIEEGSGFSGARDLPHSLQIGRDGDQEIIDYVLKEASRILIDSKEMIDAPYDVHRDVEGLYHDVGLYLMGEPESWYNEKNTLIPDKCLDVHVQCVYPGRIDKDDVKEQLKYIVAAVSVLEMSGHRVAVHAWWCSAQDDTPNSNFYKKVKDYRQPMNLAAIVGITHPAFYRRSIFRLKELTGTDDLGYGYAIQTEHKRIKGMLYLDGDAGSVEDVIKKVKKMI